MNSGFENSISDLAARLASQAERVATHLFPNGVLESNEWRVGSIAGEKGKSLGICIRGPKAGVWQDFANPEHTGDLVELWTLTHRLKKGEALHEIRDFLGIREPLKISNAKPATKPVGVASAEKQISVEYHNSLKATLAKNTVAMAYLEGEKRGGGPAPNTD
jgi:hypothetical protein